MAVRFFRHFHREDLAAQLAALAVMASLGAGLLVVGVAEAQSRPSLHLWRNAWFDVGFSILAVAALLAMTLVVSSFVTIPRLRLAQGAGPEFFLPGWPSDDEESAAKMFGGTARGVIRHRVRVDELRGVQADGVEVRLAEMVPQYPLIPVPTPLPWAAGYPPGRIPAKGHAYVELTSYIDLEDGRRMTGGVPSFGPGPVVIGLELWWRSRKRDSLTLRIREADKDHRADGEEPRLPPTPRP